ncbi:hypothetical protein GH714_015336 [Hevea brasiliensis]|uniref:NAC domain-containing protein n=1 Tax=Hevea brasiliensis TaxID=3981 RepID=A0A6A6LA90_HEVBR|nr:hypothetical protein GH714_015336 [Hevea brasiliensis]
MLFSRSFSARFALLSLNGEAMRVVLRFNPTDQELIQILDRKASEQEMPLPFIVYANLYEHEPQDLEWNHSAALGNEERYYYCKRENDSREVTGRGWWKATSHVKKVHVNENLVGYKRPLTFHRYRDQERNRNNAIKTNWIMHEYSLESKATEWRLCKIKYKGKPSMQEEMENIRQRYSSRNDSEAAGGSMNTQTGSDREQENPPPAVSSTMPLENGNHQTITGTCSSFHKLHMVILIKLMVTISTSSKSSWSSVNNNFLAFGLGRIRLKSLSCM